MRKKAKNGLCARAMKMQFSFKDYNVPEGTHVERCLWIPYIHIYLNRTMDDARCPSKQGQLFQRSNKHAWQNARHRNAANPCHILETFRLWMVSANRLSITTKSLWPLHRVLALQLCHFTQKSKNFLRSFAKLRYEPVFYCRISVAGRVCRPDLKLENATRSCVWL